MFDEVIIINCSFPMFADTFTASQAINSLGFGKFQVKLSLFTGLCWMADSMEMTILSILSPTLHCDWGISRYQQALTTTVFKLHFTIFYQILITITIYKYSFLNFVILLTEFCIFF